MRSEGRLAARYGVPLTAAAVLLAGCGTTEDARHVNDDAIYRIETVPERRAPLPPGPGEGEVLGYGIELEFRGAGFPGSVLHAPTLVVFAGQTATVVAANQVAYVQTYATELVEQAFVADPIVTTVEHGLVVELSPVPSPEGDGRILLGYHVHASDAPTPFPQTEFPLGEYGATIQLPAVERSLATGVRTLEAGVDSLLAELPEAKGIRGVQVHARVVALGLAGPRPHEEFPQFEVPPDEDHGPSLRDLIASAQRGTALRGHVRLQMMALSTAYPLGAPIPTAAIPGRVAGVSLRTMGLVGTLVPGARVAGLLEEAYVADLDVKTAGRASIAGPVVDTHRSGIVAEMLAGDRMRIRWTTTPAWDAFHRTTPSGAEATLDRPRTATHEVEIDLVPGRHLVPIARLAGGGTAAVIVTFEEAPAPKTRPGGGSLLDPRRTALLSR